MRKIKVKKIYRRNREIIIYEFENEYGVVRLNHYTFEQCSCRFDTSEAEVEELGNLYFGNDWTIGECYRFHMICQKSESYSVTVYAMHLEDILPYYNDKQYIKVSYFDKMLRIIYIKDNVNSSEICLKDGEKIGAMEGCLFSRSR